MTGAASTRKSDDRRRASWKDQFASLRNDVADPWVARSRAENSSSSASRSAPAASLPLSSDKNGGVEEQAAPVIEEVAEGVPLPPAAAASSATGALL